MGKPFRYSPNPNRASEIDWREWGDAALAEAVSLDRPVLLHLTAVWCHWCHLMDETTYSDPDVIRVINQDLVPIRVDADRHPHVQDRYIAGGWPTTAFLTPTGEVLWAGTYTEPEPFRSVAAGVLAAWRDRREELEQEIDRRRRALDAARGRPGTAGLVRREPADDVLAAAQQLFDPRNGGFGDAPKFPQPEAVELLFMHAAEDPACGAMADQTLDGMLAGELWDAVDGGFFRYATAADWTAPRHEKLLEVNAGLLEAYALGASLRGRDDWRGVAERTAAWAERTLLQPDGLWAGSQSADERYFGRGDRAAVSAPPVDATIYTSWNARWCAALALSGARLGHSVWVDRAARSLRTLFSTMTAPDGGLYHYREPDDDPQLDFLLVDTLETLRATLALAQAAGDPDWIDEARRIAQHMETAFWAEDGAFWDRSRDADSHAVGALRYRERPFEANATAARLLLDLAQATGERNWRALAERTLSRIGSLAGRYGVAAATLALATNAFFDAPPAIFIALPPGAHAQAAAALRGTAFRLPLPGLRVWTVPDGHSCGPQRFETSGVPTAWVWTRRGCSGPIVAPDQLAAAGAAAP